MLEMAQTFLFILLVMSLGVVTIVLRNITHTIHNILNTQANILRALDDMRGSRFR